MENNLDNLIRERAEVLDFIAIANKRLSGIEERIRLEGGGNLDDFSGAVARLRERGVLPPKK